VWDIHQQQAFTTLKERVMNAPVLAQPTFGDPFVLCGVGAGLMQLQKDGEKPIGFASRKLSPPERKYATREKEFLAIVFGVEKFQTHLWGQQFTVFTDHKSLLWVNKAMYECSRIARWARRVSDYTFTIEFQKGSLNTLADALSGAHTLYPLQRKRRRRVQR